MDGLEEEPEEDVPEEFPDLKPEEGVVEEAFGVGLEPPDSRFCSDFRSQ